MFCENCGAQLEDGMNFCDRCGARVGGGFASAGTRENTRLLRCAGIMHIISAAAVLVVFLIYVSYGAFPYIMLFELAMMAFTAFVCFSGMRAKGGALAAGLGIYAVVYFVSQTLTQVNAGGVNIPTQIFQALILFGTFGMCMLVTLGVTRSRKAALIIEGIALAILFGVTLAAYIPNLAYFSGMQLVLIFMLLTGSVIYYSSIVVITVAFTPESPVTGAFARNLTLGCVALGFVTLCVASQSSFYFFTAANVRNILTSASFIGIMAIGAAIVIISGGIDLSQGAVGCIAGVVSVMVVNISGYQIFGAVAGVIIAAVIGLVNGILISRLKISPVAVTLFVAMALGGIAYALTDSGSIQNYYAEENLLNRIVIGYTIPMYFIIWMLLLFAAHLILKHTGFGEKICGQDENMGQAQTGAMAAAMRGEAGRMPAGDMRTRTVSVYMISGMCAGLCGVLYAGYASSALPTMLNGYEAYAIGAAIIGGISLAGGKGRVLGTGIGAAVMAVIMNFLIIIGVPNQTIRIVTGIVIIAALIISSLRKDALDKARGERTTGMVIVIAITAALAIFFAAIYGVYNGGFFAS